jgi:hypothetical protein
MVRSLPTAFLSAFVFVSACSYVSKDPWGWLEEPTDQIWRKVRISAIGRDIEFLVPDLKDGLGNHMAVWPEDGVSQTGFAFTFPIERLKEPFTMLANFTWDTWWGGFYKKGGEDFYMSVGLFYLEREEDLLNLELEQRVKWTSDYWLAKISGPSGDSKQYEKYFIEHLRVKPFVNDTGLRFVEHNAPRISGQYRHFTVPFSNHHYVEFSFYVNDLRYGQKEDPQWNQSRWEMVEKIMNTVRITPDPFGDQPEAIPAR